MSLFPAIRGRARKVGRVRMVLCAALLAAAAAPGTAAYAGHSGTALEVTGYAEDGTSGSIVAREAHALTTVGVDGVTLHSDGGSVTAVDGGVRQLETAAHGQGLRAELLVSNYDESIGDFSPQIGSRLLRSPAHRRAVVDQLSDLVVKQGWDGITVDLESLREKDGPGLSAFVDLLAKTLPPTASVSVDLMASTTAAGYRQEGYQLPELAKSADVLALMSYDRHGPTWSRPGAIGPLGWQHATLAALLDQVPAAQVDLGVAGYGYTWPAAPHQHEGRQVTDAGARRIVANDGATARWVPRDGEWTATLHDGTVIWWSDAKSWLLRVAMAENAGLHGLALWRIGSADPLP